MTRRYVATVAVLAAAASVALFLAPFTGRTDVRVIVNGVPLAIPAAYVRYPGQRVSGPAAGVTLDMVLPDMAPPSPVDERLLQAAGVQNVIGVTVSDPDLGADAEASYRHLAEAGYWRPDALDRTRDGWQRLPDSRRWGGGQTAQAYVAAGRVAMLAFCDAPASAARPRCQVRARMAALPLLVSFSIPAALLDRLPGLRRKVFSKIAVFARGAA